MSSPHISKVFLPASLVVLAVSGCAATLGLDTPVRSRGDGSHRVIAGTADELRAGARAVFSKMGDDFTVSDQGQMVQAVFDKEGVVLRYKAFLSPGPSAGETDVEMICEMISRVKIDAVKKCENNFLNALADAAELARLKKTGPPSDPARSAGELKNAFLLSDIDELPAVKAKPRHAAYAIVIGIEHYRQKLPPADFAASDAKLVAAYLTSTLGVPEENVVALLNDRALKSDLEKYFDKWLPNNVEAGSSVYVYYSGHGAPNPRTGDAYLVPYDGDPSFIDETGFSLKRLYAALGRLPAKEIVVALDSCFSGAGGRSVLAKGARPIVLSVENPVLANKNIKVLSASAGDQTSSTYDEKGHGLFTYFMLKGIKNEDVVRKDGSLDIASLYDYVKPQVSNIARKKYNNEQTPQFIGAKNK